MTDLLGSAVNDMYSLDDNHSDFSLSSLVGSEMESHLQMYPDSLDYGTTSLHNDVFSRPPSPISASPIDPFVESNNNGNDDNPLHPELEQVDNPNEVPLNPISDNERLMDLLPAVSPLPLLDPLDLSSFSISDLSLTPPYDGSASTSCSDENQTEYSPSRTTMSSSPFSDGPCTPAFGPQECNPISRQHLIYFKRLVSLSRRRRGPCGTLMYNRLRSVLGYSFL